MKCYFTTKFIICYLLGGSTPKSPAKTESETPKKKPEMWCNVGVFDTNTTIVSDYIASPETNEQVDLVTATLGGRRFQLEPGTAYKFRVCAVNGCGTGPWSDVAAFKTTLPGFPGAPSAIKISKSPEGAHLTWEPPGGNSSEILEYAVYLAVRSASQGCQPVTTNQAQLAFVRVFCGPTNKCMVGANSLQAAHIDTTTKPAIIFRIAARNSKGYGPATQVRWLQESQNGTSQGVKRPVK
ncbi:Host cell factor, putative [Pediculus humanus corporis]|uniref:Host cell factor, putative n=1 Tax=Pediculus humanus subsp. corporis TaxID=121224 RepID=E0VPX7_PEDHC|nr:Host cell factor, putative [Pediculus humanus corporis]EEB15433.1 Host cell factor, putative [Pediculus humanus corporis]